MSVLKFSWDRYAILPAVSCLSLIFVCPIKVEVYSYSSVCCNNKSCVQVNTMLDHHSMFALVYNTCMYKYQAHKADGYHHCLYILYSLN